MALVAGLALLQLLASTGLGRGASALHLGGGLFALSVVLLAPLEDQGVVSVKGLGQAGLVAVPGGLGRGGGPSGRRIVLEDPPRFRALPLEPRPEGGGVPHPVAGAFALAVPLALGVSMGAGRCL
jgi:hypothetical protein